MPVRGKRSPGKRGGGDGHYVYNARVANASNARGTKQENANLGFATRKNRKAVKKLHRAAKGMHGADGGRSPY